MSIKVSSWVWEHSEQKGTALLLMLALGDIANDEGVCWPGIARLARKTRTTERNVKLLLHKLEDADELEILRGVGRHHTNVYGFKSYRDDLRRKGEDITPLAVYAIQKGEIQRTKGEIQRQEKVKGVSPEPLVRTVKEPSLKVVETLPDDTTTRCLQLLLQTKGFPRDQGENALKLAEYRSQFPSVDPVEVCQDFKAYTEETGKSANRLRLRNFFKMAAKRPDIGKNGNSRRKSIAVIGASEADYDESEYRFHA